MWARCFDKTGPGPQQGTGCALLLHMRHPTRDTAQRKQDHRRLPGQIHGAGQHHQSQFLARQQTMALRQLVNKTKDRPQLTAVRCALAGDVQHVSRPGIPLRVQGVAKTWNRLALRMQPPGSIQQNGFG